MLIMKIPAEIQDYKSKLLFGLSVRQTFSIAGAVLVGVPIGVCGRGHISEDVLPWLVILAVMPFFGFGFFQYKGMRFEEWLRAIVNMWFTPQVRVYEDANDIFGTLHEELIAQLIAQQRTEVDE